MYLGRHVVFLPRRTSARASGKTPWQMAATGLPVRQKSAMNRWSSSLPSAYCFMPGA